MPPIYSSHQEFSPFLFTIEAFEKNTMFFKNSRYQGMSNWHRNDHFVKCWSIPLRNIKMLRLSGVFHRHSTPHTIMFYRGNNHTILSLHYLHLPKTLNCSLLHVSRDSVYFHTMKKSLNTHYVFLVWYHFIYSIKSSGWTCKYHPVKSFHHSGGAGVDAKVQWPDSASHDQTCWI